MAIRKDKLIKIKSTEIDARAEFYENAYDVVEDCRNRSVHISDYDITSEKMKKNWHGVDSYDEALDLLRNGYQPVVDKFREELKVQPKDGPRISFSNNIQGFAPVVPLALKCVPNSMVDMRMKTIKTKVLDVYYDMTSAAYTSPDEFIKAGKALLASIIELEKQGYRFNLFAVQSYYKGGRNASLDVLCVKIKSSNKPLDLKRMSFPLTHPAFFRVIGFDWQGKSPITRDIGSGRGYALGYDYNAKELNDIAKKMFGANACYIPCSNIISDDYDTKVIKEGFVNVSSNKQSPD